ncbi:glycosyltransferase domain-containing protein [Ulvibacterium sp.]|uniref:glycosyltransferase domain-containing protein n=1 Tax=Ulvibacterium sp. TaxID=2665914 RepID=UPI003BACFE7A
MKVITVATDLRNYNLRTFLMPCCDFLGYKLIILYFGSTWSSHRLKDQILIPYLESLDSDEIVLFTDAYDTLLLNTPKSLLAKFMNFNAPIVFSAEINCWPEQGLIDIYHKIDSETRFLNSGAFMGRVSHILKLLNRYNEPASKVLTNKYKVAPKVVEVYDKKYFWSNQYYWTLLYFTHENSIKLDNDSELFLTLGTPLPYFRKYKKDFANLGAKSDIYITELKRVIAIFNTMKPYTKCHVHFNNPVLKAVFKDLYERQGFPSWIRDMLSKKTSHLPQIIEVG